jgi:SWI/SNF-related matrix-associated actin-dependent regulator of chromatin subfamily A3
MLRNGKCLMLSESFGAEMKSWRLTHQIDRCLIRLAGEMLVADRKLASPCNVEGADVAQFRVERGPSKADLLFLKFADGTNFASVNTHISKAFVSLLETPVRLEAVACISTVRDRIRQAKKANDATVRVSINVYGPRTNKEHLGRELSKSKVWLQKPDHWKPGTEYENPQFLAFHGLEQPMVSHPIPVKQGSKDLFDDPDEFRRAVAGVYANLRRDDNLRQVEKDRRVKTTLLPQVYCKTED